MKNVIFGLFITWDVNDPWNIAHKVVDILGALGGTVFSIFMCIETPYMVPNPNSLETHSSF